MRRMYLGKLRVICDSRRKEWPIIIAFVSVLDQATPAAAVLTKLKCEDEK
jgi:hypothetical protein